MSAEPDDRSSLQGQERLRAALIANCHLTDSQVEQITSAASSGRGSFGDVAVEIGLVTANELRQTKEYLRVTAEDRETGIIETAIRRRKPSRDVVLRPRTIVQASKEIVLVNDPFNPRCERMRALRTELMLLDDMPSQSQVIAVISPCAGEGRSLLAAELAAAFSQLRRRTLLIDGDLRRPRQHALFQADNTGGLAEALAVGGTPKYLGVDTLPELSVLTAGAASANPLEMLSDGRFARLVADCRFNFDHIIIDTPPVGEYADALSIATTAGRTIVLSRAGITPQKAMKEMLRRLQSTQARTLGAVLSHF
jgi:receptor protein-tyrosine kinase